MLVTPKLLDPGQEADFFLRMEATKMCGTRTKLLWWTTKGVLMAGKRKQHSATFKAQVALAALKGDRTVNELAGQFGVHPTLIHGWKKQLLTQAETLFANGSKASTADAEAEKTELFEQIGRLKMELEWLKKKVGPLP